MSDDEVFAELADVYGPYPRSAVVDGRRPEPFRTLTSVFDHQAEDPFEVKILEAYCRGEGWRDAVDMAGGTPLDALPRLTRVENAHYGQPIYNKDCEAVFGEDGRKLLDRVKFWILATGWATRP